MASEAEIRAALSLSGAEKQIRSLVSICDELRFNDALNCLEAGLQDSDIGNLRMRAFLTDAHPLFSGRALQLEFIEAENDGARWELTITVPAAKVARALEETGQ